MSRVVKGTDGRKYYLCRLDSPVECIRAKTGEKWTLKELALGNYFQGGSIENLTANDKEHFTFVRLLNPEGSIAIDGALDLSKAVYFGLGRAWAA